MIILHYVDENRLSWSKAWIQLIKELERRGVHNHVVCKSGGTLAASLAAERISCDTLDVPAAWLPGLALGLGRIIDKVKPRVIHTRLSSAARIGGYWGARKNIPVAQSVDKYPRRHYHKRATCLLPCSLSIRDHLLGIGFPESRMKVLFNAIDTVSYKPDPALRLSKRRELGLGGGQLLIVSAGRFVAFKGFDNLLSAYALWLSSDADAAAETRLLLAGGGEEKDALTRLIAELGIGQNVIMPGFVPDIRPYLRAADIFVLPSKEPEPFGIVLLEAMASGVACVATRGGGALDMITDGENGWFAELDSVSSLSSLFPRAAWDEAARKKIAEGALKRAAEFDVGKIADQLMSVYEELAVPQR